MIVITAKGLKLKMIHCDVCSKGFNKLIRISVGLAHIDMCMHCTDEASATIFNSGESK